VESLSLIRLGWMLPSGCQKRAFGSDNTQHWIDDSRVIPD
jgi:hypothetical protein